MVLIARLRGLFYRFTSPIFVRSVGRGSLFFGNFRYSRIFNNAKLGKNCMVGHSVYMQCLGSAKLEIGNNTSLNTGCHVVAIDRIEIGDNVAIGEFTSIRDQEHGFCSDTGVRGQPYRTAPITIENNVWIGRGVYIGPGSVIRSGSIVAANSVVRGDFPANVLLAGCPAVVKRKI